MSFRKRKRWFAAVAFFAGIVLLLASGFKEVAVLGMGVTIVGVFDFLFAEWSLDGKIASEVYGDPGEELWQFRSFALMMGGPFVILYSILFL